MFIGEYQHNLDEKGRLAIPAKFRTKLAKGQYHHIFDYQSFEMITLRNI